MSDAIATPSSSVSPTASPWAPFRHKMFTLLWVAIVVSNVGTWMHDLSAGWLMATLTPSPLLVASVQAATTLPVFLFALPAGALADIVDRRRLLLIVKIILTIVAIAMSLSVYLNFMNPWLLLIFTLLMGTGAAFIAPAWQAIVPQLVPRPELQQAIALNSVGINISRAIGPAVGGLVIAVVGLWAPFMLNAISFIFVIGVLIWWKAGSGEARALPAERFTGAIRAGLRYTRESGPVRNTLYRAIGFFLFATCYWALLPLIARDLLKGGPSYYGLLLASIGGGAVLAALGLPKLKKILGPNKVVATGSAGTALVLVIFAMSSNQIAGLGASMLAGASWLAVLSSLNVSTQLALPEWVRARGLSMLLTVYFGAMAGGSVIWGNIAGQIGVPTTLLIAAGGAALAIPITWRWKIIADPSIDLTPSFHWPVPVMASEIEEDRGPVMVTVEYQIDPKNREAFQSAMENYGHTRRRDGAFSWGIFEDVSAPGRFLEYFLVDSWLEHERQHHRVTEADIEIEKQVMQYHLGETRPIARHLIAPTPPKSQ
ncbi:MAG: MFS transporter [Rhodospirillaceae bacterium]|jgi:MFS family permease|nr:MFS transporter [Rhodospirillaceae bacterium]MBT4588442.1 MFS transporter [Rhodospirillaceae bacterium]MBT7265532.1 MFS transporter [Rhodospirillaceae bacterium]